MDQRYSIALGRPLGISGIDDYSPTASLATSEAEIRLDELMNQFTILARRIARSDGIMSVDEIDDLTGKLMGLLNTIPEKLRINQAWTRSETAPPEWPLDVMSATCTFWYPFLHISRNSHHILPSGD